MSSEAPEAIRARHFATVVLNAFAEAGNATDSEIAAAGGPSSTTMTKLRKVALGEILMVEPRNDTYRRIEAAASWKPGSARALWRDTTPPEVITKPSGLAGLIPNVTPSVAINEIDAYLAELAARITELEERVDLIDPIQQDQLKKKRNMDMHPPVRGAKAARKAPSAGRARRAQQDDDAELD